MRWMLTVSGLLRWLDLVRLMWVAGCGRLGRKSATGFEVEGCPASCVVVKESGEAFGAGNGERKFIEGGLGGLAG